MPQTAQDPGNNHQNTGWVSTVAKDARSKAPPPSFQILKEEGDRSTTVTDRMAGGGYQEEHVHVRKALNSVMEFERAFEGRS